MEPCDRVQQIFNDGEWPDGFSSALPEDLRAHVRQCAMCQEIVQLARSEEGLVDQFLARTVPVWRTSVPVVDLTERVLAQVRGSEHASTDEDLGDAEFRAAWLADQASVLRNDVGPAPDSVASDVNERKGRGHRWVGAALGVAAALAVVWMAIPRQAHIEVPVATFPTENASSNPRPEDARTPARAPNPGVGNSMIASSTPQPTEAAVPGSAVTKSTTVEEPLPLSHLFANANVAWSDLARETSETIGDVVALSRPAAQTHPPVQAPPTETGNSALIEVPTDWIPLRRQFGSALEFLRESLQDDEAGRSSRAS